MKIYYKKIDKNKLNSQDFVLMTFMLACAITYIYLADFIFNLISNGK